MDNFSDPRALAQLLMLQQMQPISISPLMVSDAVPYPVLQEFAMNIKDPRKIKEGVPKSQFKTIEPLAPYGAGATGPGALRLPAKVPARTAQEIATEKAFEQIRQESAGMTREQRREQMRQQGQQDFDRVQNMPTAEYDAELDAIRRALQRK